MGEFNKGYTNLFGMENEENDEEGTEPDSEGEDERGDGEDEYLSQYLKRWGWFDYSVIVKEIKSITLDEVYELNIIEFLNICCYHKDKCAFEKKLQEEYLKKIRTK